MAACLQELQFLRRRPHSDAPAHDAQGLAGKIADDPTECDPGSFDDALRPQRRRRTRRNKVIWANAKGMSAPSQSSERQELREENAREYSRSEMSPFHNALEA